ncbi:MAG: hypothetical protein HY325_00165 [Chloroflexi bacterium]|nr:hypothetical protein [Chloroflexota bacterium]
MGKHEREDVYIAENILNDLLNGETIDQARKRHEFYRYADALFHRIKNDFPMMKRSHHIGNVYGTSVGDIKLNLPSEEVYLELKFLASGSGTRASMGQDALTDFGLFIGENILSWSEFRERKDHTGWVMRELNKFEPYPKEIVYKTGKNAIYEKANYLKKRILGINNENTKTFAEAVLRDKTSSKNKITAAEIIVQIMEKDRREKIEYLNYLKTLKQNKDNIKKLLFLILAGAHTYESLKLQWEIDLNQIIGTLRHEYFVYYIYKSTLSTKVEDFSTKLNHLLDKEIYMSFHENQTNVLLSFVDRLNIEIPILRIVFHWKNKFQGIETPCLHIFDDRYLKEEFI